VPNDNLSAEENKINSDAYYEAKGDSKTINPFMI